MTERLNPPGYTWQRYLPAAAILCAFVAVSLAIVGFNHILVVVLVTGGIVVLLGHCPAAVAMTARWNPRGYNWRTYLRKTWWRSALVVGFGLVLWRGTTRELHWYTPIVPAVILISTGWDTWQGWRSK